MQICHCGQQPGYLHNVDCPFPLYHDAPDRVATWNAERENMRRQIAENEARRALQREANSGGGLYLPPDPRG